VQYGPNPWQVADIVFPHRYDQPVNAESPVVIWIHGGGWNSGSRGDIANKVKLFTQRTGIIGLNIDYRLGTETVPCWPGASEDIEAAAAFALSDAMPCISGPIYLYGYSAGGTLAVKYALDCNSGANIDAVICVGSPLDFEAWSFALANLVVGFGENWLAENPRGDILGTNISILMLHGGADPIVPAAVNQAVHSLYHTTRLVEIGGGDHALTGKEDIEFAEALKAMLRS